MTSSSKQTYLTRHLTARDHQLVDALERDPRYAALARRLRPDGQKPVAKPSPKPVAKADAKPQEPTRAETPRQPDPTPPTKTAAEPPGHVLPPSSQDAKAEPAKPKPSGR